MKKFLFSMVIGVMYMGYVFYERGQIGNAVLQPAQNAITNVQTAGQNTAITDSPADPNNSTPPKASANPSVQNPVQTAAVSKNSQNSTQQNQNPPQNSQTTQSQVQTAQYTPPTPVQTTPPPPAPTHTPAPQPQGQYKDGQYTGSSADAYYGLVQVKAIISGGKITDVQFLSYPNDRQNSVNINSQAMPILTQEAILAQSVNVDIVSGATDTSQAFIQSLSSALSQAKI
jgi:uncharacterized protein with FMN-binding domain